MHIQSVFVARGPFPTHVEVLNNPWCHHHSVIFMKLPSVLGAVPKAVRSEANSQAPALLTGETSTLASLRTSKGSSYENVLTANKATEGPYV